VDEGASSGGPLTYSSTEKPEYPSGFFLAETYLKAMTQQALASSSYDVNTIEIALCIWEWILGECTLGANYQTTVEEWLKHTNGYGGLRLESIQLAVAFRASELEAFGATGKIGYNESFDWEIVPAVLKEYIGHIAENGFAADLPALAALVKKIHSDDWGISEPSNESEVYLTNGCGESTDHVSASALECLGLSCGPDCYPLTENEMAQTAETMRIPGNEYVWMGLYTTLRGGRKWHTPTLELPFMDEFWGEEANQFDPEELVRKEAEEIKTVVEPWAVERGGDVVIEENMPARFVVRIRYPLR
jgi:hypothetical protein